MSNEWNEIRSHYKALENQTYFLTSAIGAIHGRVQKAISEELDLQVRKGAIGEIRFFEMCENLLNATCEFVGAQRPQVAITPNTSHNMSLLAQLFWKIGYRTVVLPKVEFPSSVYAWKAAGFKMIFTDDDETQMLEYIRPLKNVLCVCSGVQYLTGKVMDVERLGRELNTLKVPFVLNATQMLGAHPLKFEEWKVSAATATCHKWLSAGFGTSILYINEIWNESPPLMAGWNSVKEPWITNYDNPDWKEGAEALMLGTMPFALIPGLIEAFKVQREIGQEKISKRTKLLGHKLFEVLESHPVDLGIYGNGGIVSFTHEKIDEISSYLEEAKIFMSLRQGRLRAGIHFYNNEEDLAHLDQTLKNYFSNR